MPTSDQTAPSNWNVPNALTVLRIVMVPFFAWALLVDGGDSVLWRCVAWLLFVLAMITDKIDGDLARKHNLVTNFGKIAESVSTGRSSTRGLRAPPPLFVAIHSS